MRTVCVKMCYLKGMKYSTLILALLLVVSSVMAAAQGTLVDKRDGKKYKTVQIGSQTWMAENLNYKTKESYCYEDKSANCKKNGRLYKWDAALQACPAGWHLPNKEEFEALFASIGGDAAGKGIAKKLKSKTGWSEENGIDAFGFSVRPVGSWTYSGDYYGYIGMDDIANFWSSSGAHVGNAFCIDFLWNSDDVYLGAESADLRLSVRCLKDDEKEFVDNRDGKKYKTVIIGDQTWMAENLNYETENSFCYEEKAANCKKYGRLYTWETALNVCPAGWHLPSKEEFEVLIAATGGVNVAGKALKSKGGWNGKIGNGSDAFGFSVLPAGSWDSNGGFNRENYNATFWCSTENDSNGVCYMNLSGNFDDVLLSIDPFKHYKVSVRCLLDDDESEVQPVNAAWNVYNDEKSSASLIDERDGKTYRTVSIGNQTWMAENLNYESNDSYCLENKSANCKKYGRLYAWNAAQKACPVGWHLPDKEEFKTLFEAVGGQSSASKALKSKAGWNGNSNGNDSFGFSGFPTSYRSINGGYGAKGEFAYFWSSSERSRDLAYYMYLYDYNSVGLEDGPRDYGFSVRCLRNGDESTRSVLNVTAGSMIDERDGKTYKTVTIGDRTWMAENLNYKTNDSYCYKDKAANCSKYGRLYAWDAARSACPEGWHLPDKEEFERLFKSVGGESIAGKKLKSKNGWKDGGNGTDSFGFSALASGCSYGYDSKGYNYEGIGADFWSSSEANAGSAYYMVLDYRYLNAGLETGHTASDRRLSVRCIQDYIEEVILFDSSEGPVLAASVVVDENSSAGSLIDKRDGKKYKTVQIGSQTWMAENLNYKTQDSYCYDDNSSNCSKYGRLYTWNAATSACPEGWHLPNNAEFETLFESVGGKQVAGVKLKAKSDWNSDGNGTDVFGFSAIPAGVRSYDGNYLEEGNFSHFWSSTKASSYDAFYIYLNYGMDNASRSFNDKLVGFSVRCLQDAGELGEPNSSAGTLVDTRDGKSYKTVEIGNQTWMAENLNYKTQDSYCYGGKFVNCKKYGRLYKWNAARTACPSGWHLPSKEEFDILPNLIGSDQFGKSLKSKVGWKDGGNGVDTYGFSVLPAGYNYDGEYHNEGISAAFWSSTEDNSDAAYEVNFVYEDDLVGMAGSEKEMALSVRCVKD